MKDAYNVKIELKTLTIHDLQKVIQAFLNEDYWTPEQGIEIETVEYEPQGEKPKMKLAEKIVRTWRFGILIYLGIAGTLVLLGTIKNPLTQDQIAGIVVLMFALMHTEYIGKALERKGLKK